MPESKVLVSGASDNILAVWADGKEEDACGVACEGCETSHAGITPQHNLKGDCQHQMKGKVVADLVLGVAMGAHNLIDIFRPSKVAHLVDSQ